MRWFSPLQAEVTDVFDGPTLSRGACGTIVASIVLNRLLHRHGGSEHLQNDNGNATRARVTTQAVKIDATALCDFLHNSLGRRTDDAHVHVLVLAVTLNGHANILQSRSCAQQLSTIIVRIGLTVSITIVTPVSKMARHSASRSWARVWFFNTLIASKKYPDSDQCKSSSYREATNTSMLSDRVDNQLVMGSSLNKGGDILPAIDDDPSVPVPVSPLLLAGRVDITRSL